jgi:nucleotide-binding universal stress UspA family protein
VAIEASAPVAIPPFDGFMTTQQHPSPEEVVAAQAMIDAIKAEMGSARVHARVEMGSAADAICRVADELAVDLIVIGARGMNPATRWLLGSVSDRVVHHANQPVTVVR